MYRGDREILEETLDEAERPLTLMATNIWSLLPYCEPLGRPLYGTATVRLTTDYGDKKQ